MKTFEEIMQTTDLNDLSPIEYCIWYCGVHGRSISGQEARKAAAELAEKERALEEVRYCPSCGNVITPCDNVHTLWYCGMCNKSLFESETDTHKGQTRSIPFTSPSSTDPDRAEVIG